MERGIEGVREGRRKGEKRENIFKSLTLAAALSGSIYLCQVERDELLRYGFVLKQVWQIHNLLSLALVQDALAIQTPHKHWH